MGKSGPTPGGMGWGAPRATGLFHHTTAPERVLWTLLLWAGVCTLGELMEQGRGLEPSVMKPPPLLPSWALPRGLCPCVRDPGTLTRPLRQNGAICIKTCFCSEAMPFKSKRSIFHKILTGHCRQPHGSDSQSRVRVPCPRAESFHVSCCLISLPQAGTDAVPTMSSKENKVLEGSAPCEHSHSQARSHSGRLSPVGVAPSPCSRCLEQDLP